MRKITVLLVLIILIIYPFHNVQAASVNVHSSNRYYTDTNGTPIFLLGYYGWEGYGNFSWDGKQFYPTHYSEMINHMGNYELNYLRVTLGIAKNPASGTPFVHVNGKADLDQWNTSFWNDLEDDIKSAQAQNIIVHIGFFDGVGHRTCDSTNGVFYRWNGSYWNINNQIKSFYGNIDKDNDCRVDESGEFYNATAFESNTGLGAYQRKLIDKAILEFDSYDNVMYEIGNETFGTGGSAWYTAVIDYVKSKSNKPITINLSSFSNTPGNTDGYAQHIGNTSTQVNNNVKNIVSSILSKSISSRFPVWEDPDGPDLIYGPADELRRSAWYSFVGGAAGWGGFTTDFWDRDFDDSANKLKVQYYKNLITFINSTNVQFWHMVPRNDLISAQTENSLLAEIGTEYVAYILNDTTATIDLSGTNNTFEATIYDPRTGSFLGTSTINGSGSKNFTKPSGLDDWVIYLKKTTSGTTPTTSPIPTATPTPVSNKIISAPASNLVTNGTVAGSTTSGQYTWNTLTNGVNMYNDRTFTFTNTSPLPNFEYLVTSNDDKFSSTSSNFITFTANKDIEVYVLYTNVNTTLESTWLTTTNGWEKQTYTIATTLPGTETNREVSKKSYKQGDAVTLKGNGSTQQTSSMYNVVIKASGVKPGDTDGDGDVDIFDYSTVLSNFGKTVSGRDKGDLDGDNDVDIFDYNAVISHFGT